MFERYAIFYTPPPGPLAEFAASWLGWDSETATAVPHPAIAGVDVSNVTATPRKYGFHGTLKAPFHLNPACSADELKAAIAVFSATQAPVVLDAFQLRQDHGFVALRPQKHTAMLREFASKVVREFDQFRAALTELDIARRRQAELTDRQDRQMIGWGYPYIFDDFSFHLTLSGQLSSIQRGIVIDVLEPLLEPVLSEIAIIDAITLVGQDSKGMFHQICRYALTG
ncbi:DUF1045 domain-containing protein [Parasedimentitalea maritima]|uniref:DUF1045 domain-containing protein n=1 Tax=Parasedimentitalea maritima TaxID=2578117 RepID=A0A6A4RE75_9RHOB|nr:DUF1045 domain-containing protein [Zongyanglinia marina]KAE9628591.1 DUF1045 domain-containing protein [Zongyanglinia marina]